MTKRIMLLGGALMLAVLSGCGDGGFVPPCIPAARPVATPPPQLGAAAVGEFGARLRIAFIVDSDGHLSEPVLESATLESGDGELPPGYAEALLQSMSDWRFRPPLMRCRGRLEMTVAHSQTRS